MFERKRKKILVVEDNELNREILTAMLSDEYDTITAENGAIGYQILAEHFHELSLVLLDVYMPVMNGFEFLEKLAEDPLLSKVPVIVATGSDKPEDETRCLRMGAWDFVTKPYNPDVVMARVDGVIGFHNAEDALAAVEYDQVSGLYTMQAFEHYAEDVLQAEPDAAFDVLVCDIDALKLVNSVFGSKTGDAVLAHVGQRFRTTCKDALTARSGDRFYALRPAADRLDEERGLQAIDYMLEDCPVPGLRLNVGLYRNVDRSVPVSMLCDRATMAVEAIRDNYDVSIGIYDEGIQRRQLEERRMEGLFDTALAEGQFEAWYQPKVNVCTGRIVGAEALVRWRNPDGTLVAPFKFIPLFERDGLIARLDEYMFRTVCAFQAKRLAAGAEVVPISINLSRNSLYGYTTGPTYTAIAEEAGVPKDLVPIELTESAVAEDALVHEIAHRLVDMGFVLHMDDFGTGYSSLVSLATMPFDVVKLDKSLIDRIGDPKGNVIVSHMIGVAQELGMRVVSEGVEEQSQVEFLRSISCDMIQGYFFSAPKPQQTFEGMLDSGEPLGPRNAGCGCATCN